MKRQSPHTPILPINALHPFGRKQNSDFLHPKPPTIRKRLPHSSRNAGEMKESFADNGFPTTRLPYDSLGLCRDWSLGELAREGPSREMHLVWQLLVMAASRSHLGATHKVRFSSLREGCVCVPVFLINITNIDRNNRDASQWDAVHVNITQSFYGGK